MRFGKTWFLTLALTMALCLSACRSGPDAIVIKMGHSLDASHSVHQAMEYLSERLVEKSDSTMRVDIYPSQQLGTERELLELLQIGSVGMTKVSSSALEGFVPEYQVLGLPYLFRDERHRFEVFWNSEVGRDILASGQEFGLRGLTYYDAGTRSFYTKTRPVHAPADLQGLKIRVQESPVAMRMVQALGGSPTPIAWGELYTALQQGVVDGAENNPPSFYLSGHYEVCKYYTLDAHTAVPDVVLVSMTLWNSLTEQQRAWLREAALESAERQRVLWAESVQASLAAVRKAGVEIIEPDIAPFADGVASMYEAYRDDPVIRPLIDRIREVR